jgi:hypothetical protein
LSCTAAPEVQPILQPLTEAFFQAASFVGMGSMEFKRDSKTGQFLMIEPTVGRVDFQEEVATLHGANIPLAAYLHEVGLDVPAVENNPVSVIWRGSWNYARSGRDHHVKRDERSRFHKSHDAHWRLSDPMPALFYAGIVLCSIGTRPIIYLRRTAKDTHRRSERDY